ncbi:hypothetical protein DITRI_Ditri08aG0017600 [Diplodiscus trichospermus]
MFSFSRRRMKLGRVKKVQLSESAHGKKSYETAQTKQQYQCEAFDLLDFDLVESAMPAGSHSDEFDSQCPSTAPEINSSGNSDNWMVLSVAGEKPVPRFNRAAAVVGNKMIVVAGESGNGLLDDVLNFDNFSLTTASSKLYLSPSSLPLKIPSCKGHSLVSWGERVLLVGGRTDPLNERISGSRLESSAITRLSLFLYMMYYIFRALFWFLQYRHLIQRQNVGQIWKQKEKYRGTRPSPRSNHVATLYDDKTLFIFGGTSKSRTLNDLYSLDFETMIWSRIKIQGFHPSPRAACCGVLCGTKWYIAGGGSMEKRHTKTLIYDVLKSEWSVAIASLPSSITTKGFSLVLVQHEDKNFLVAFGGCRKEPSNPVEVLIIEKNESSMGP